jgi:hypothetical protein
MVRHPFPERLLMLPFPASERPILLLVSLKAPTTLSSPQALVPSNGLSSWQQYRGIAGAVVEQDNEEEGQKAIRRFSQHVRHLSLKCPFRR